MLLIDSHTHVFPDEVCQDRARFLDRDGWFGTLYENPKAKLATVEQLLASMDERGIDGAVMCGFPWSDPGLCRYHNDYMADAAHRYSDRLRWLATVAPSQAREAAKEAELQIERGAAGLGELNADAQGFNLSEPGSLDEIVGTCLEAGKPLMVHVSEPVGHAYPGKGTATPDKLLVFLEAFPELQVIAAHWGGGLPFYELMPEVRHVAANVIYDSAASTYLYQFDIFPIAERLVGAERIVLGTDYPLLRQDRFFNRVQQLEWPSEASLAMIVGGNAQHLFGFPAERRIGGTP